jgi:hypothetical protein
MIEKANFRSASQEIPSPSVEPGGSIPRSQKPTT